jgi:hypothetical protein
MRHRPTSIRLAGLGLAAGALVLVAACSSTAVTAAPGASSAASVAPPASTSTGAGSSAAPSSAVLPGFSLPSDDKGLEALLPSTLCGQPSIKLSLSGASFAAGADPAFAATLSQLGKSLSDVGFAIASADPTKAANCGVTAGVFEVKGADGNALKTFFLAAATQEEKTYTESTLGGKDVFLDTSETSKKSYAYFKGDGIFFVEAPDDTTSATVLAQMP